MIYPKTWAGACYEVLDETEYDRYWWGKRPSSRMIFEEYLTDPEATQNMVALRHGKWPTFFSVHMRGLVNQGILRRLKPG